MCCSVGFDNCALAAQRRVLQHSFLPKAEIDNVAEVPISGREPMQQRAHQNSLDHLGSILVASVAQSYKLGLSRWQDAGSIASVPPRYSPSALRDAARFMTMECPSL